MGRGNECLLWRSYKLLRLSPSIVIRDQPHWFITLLDGVAAWPLATGADGGHFPDAPSSLGPWFRFSPSPIFGREQAGPKDHDHHCALYLRFSGAHLAKSTK
jgi:hypothetical protein